MKALCDFIFNFGSRTSIWVILVLIVALNSSWLVTLDVFGGQFEQIAGYLPIDLQNTSTILSAPQALEQIVTYNTEARIFYWVFFVLDNLMPPLVFGSFTFLWAYYLSRSENRFLNRLRSSAFLLIPLGVGVFDWLENLCFVSVIADPAAANALQLMEVGLIFTRLKAAFLFATFILTFVLTVYHLLTSVLRLRRRADQPKLAQF